MKQFQKYTQRIYDDQARIVILLIHINCPHQKKKKKPQNTQNLKALIKPNTKKASSTWKGLTISQVTKRKRTGARSQNEEGMILKGGGS